MTAGNPPACQMPRLISSMRCGKCAWQVWKSDQVERMRDDRLVLEVLERIAALLDAAMLVRADGARRREPALAAQLADGLAFGRHARLPFCRAPGSARVLSASARRALLNIRPRRCPRRRRRRPAHLHVAEHALGVRHQRGEAAVGGRHRGQAAGAAVRIGRIGLGRPAVVVDEAHRRVHLRRVAALREVGEALAVRDRDRQAAAGHVAEEDRRRRQHLDQAAGAPRTARSCCA